MLMPARLAAGLAGAHGIGVLAEAGLRQEIVHDEAGDRREDHQHRDAEDAAVADAC